MLHHAVPFNVMLYYAIIDSFFFLPLLSALSYTVISGVCHAENDEDKKAIICLKRSVEEDPYSTDSLLALGTRYLPLQSDNYEVSSLLATGKYFYVSP